MKRIKPFWLTRLAVFALALSVFAACSDDDGTGPDGSLDPAEAATAMDQLVTQFLDGNEALAAINVFGALIPDAIGPDVVPLNLLPIGTEGSLYEWGNRLRMNVADLDASEVANIPPVLMGTTFVYNPETGSYEPSETLTDAPSNGVRFIIYAVDPVLGQPVLPLEEVGHIDVVDNSANLVANIGMTVVVNEVTAIDATVVGTNTQTGSEVDFSGILSNGQELLDFGIVFTGTETSGSLEFEASFGPYTVTLGFSGDQAISTGTFTATFSDGDDIIAFTLSVSGDGLIDAGSGVTINGQTVAIISGTLDEPVITNAEGDPLDQQQLAALEQLFIGIGEVFEVFSSLLFFGFLLLSLAF